jgi:hypothetical protein
MAAQSGTASHSARTPSFNRASSQLATSRPFPNSHVFPHSSDWSRFAPRPRPRTASSMSFPATRRPRTPTGTASLTGRNMPERPIPIICNRPVRTGVIRMSMQMATCCLTRMRQSTERTRITRKAMEISSLMVKRSRTGPIPSCHPPQAPARPITTAMGSATNEEASLGTSPLNPDMDGDGSSDGDEVEADTDPLDPTG